MDINDKLESTRNDFEISIAYIINNSECYKYRNIYDRYDDGQYMQAWIDSAWMGWCAAIKHVDSLSK